MISFAVEKDINFQKGVFFKGILETANNNWDLSGAWRKNTDANSDGGDTLSVVVSGLNFKDLLPSYVGQTVGFEFDSTIRLKIVAPFLADGTPQTARLNIGIDGGVIEIAKETTSKLLGGSLNFQVLPKENQIILEPSPLKFESTSTVLVGDLRYPRIDSGDAAEKPVFRLQATDFDAFGLVGNGPRPKGNIDFQGHVDTVAQALTADKIVLKTPSGTMGGSGSIRFGRVSPGVQINLSMDKMPVAEFKQFWPPMLASGLREWVRDGVSGGTIENAWLKADIPSAIIGLDDIYESKHLSAQFPLYKTSVTTVGELPAISNAYATIDLRGNKTTVSLDKGEANLGRQGTISVGKSSLVFGSYARRLVPAELNLSLSGSAGAMAELGSLKPLGFMQKLGNRTNRCVGIGFCPGDNGIQCR